MVELAKHYLDETHVFLVGELPAEHRLDATRFEELWKLHPETFHEIKMHGKLVKTPRWQQAYGADYKYTGNVNKALPVPPMLDALHAWARAEIDSRLNGLLLNWYDAERSQYIGKHRDSTVDMIEGAPIVTVSYGAERAFRLRPWKQEGFRDLPRAMARSSCCHTTRISRSRTRCRIQRRAKDDESRSRCERFRHRLRR